MKFSRYILVATLLLGLFVAGCEPEKTPIIDDTTQEDGSGNNNSEDNTDDNTDEEENKGDEEDNKDNGNTEEDNSWMDNPTPMPEATYTLNDRMYVSSLVTYADGLRNDYMTFYQESTGYAVYFDIYTNESNTTLPTGRYLLSNDKVNTVYYEWSYFTPYTNSDLYRFTEGWLEVIADEAHTSGYPYHKIRGYFVMDSEESVSVEFEGTIVIQ